MYFDFSPKVQDLHAQVKTFLDTEVFPHWQLREAQIAANAKAGRAYAELPDDGDAEGQGARAGAVEPVPARRPATRSRPDQPGIRAACRDHGAALLVLAEVFNCSAPDTGNMEVLARYGTQAQQERWLTPLLAGEIRSAFAMTEPDVASSDATNIECSIRREGDDYVINGRKWYITGAMNERCEVFVLMGKTDPDNADRHQQQSMILVPKNTPGVTIVRDMALLGVYDPPFGHPEMPLRERARAGRRTSCSAKAAASRSPKAGSGRGASTTACARSAWPRRRWS